MYITLETDYAIRIMTNLFNQKNRIDAKKISEETDVSLRFALKILRKLVASKLIKSYKGVKGGYEIAVESKDVSLFDIVKIFEGEYAFSRCLKGDIGCSRHKENTCKSRAIFADISDVINEKLKKSTFDQLI